MSPEGWRSVTLRRALRPGGRAATSIKGDAAAEPGDGLVPGYSASGQDVWLPAPTNRGPGLILSAVGARCGKVFEADGEWATVTNTAVLLPQAGHDPHFLWYLVNNEDFWERGGTAQPYVRVPETLARRVMLPELALQKTIARFLDAETAHIDALIAKKARLLQLLEEWRWARLDGSFVSRGEERAVALKRTAQVFVDGDWIESPYITDSGIRLIQTGNIGRGEFVDQGGRYISEETFRALKCTEVLPGDVLISRLANTVGQACVAPNLGCRMVASVDVVILRPRSDIAAEFLVCYLSTHQHLSRARLEARGSTMQRLARSQLGELPVPVMGVVDQRQVVEEAARVTQTFSPVAERLARQTALLEERRAALITLAVTGELRISGAA